MAKVKKGLSTKVPSNSFTGGYGDGSVYGDYNQLPAYKNFNTFEQSRMATPQGYASQYMNNDLYSNNDLVGLGSAANQPYTVGKYLPSPYEASLSNQSPSDSQLFNNQSGANTYTLAGGRAPTKVSNELSIMYPSSDGLGNYASYTGTDGSKVQLSKDAYDTFGSNVPEGLTVNESPSWFSQNKDAISGTAQGLQALSGLANAYMGYNNYGLAKDMFRFNKAATNANYINAAKDYNTQLQNAGEVGMGLAGNTMDANARAARQAQLDSRKVSEAAIG